MPVSYLSDGRCLSKRKDTNFKANHNDVEYRDTGIDDVCLSAKIRILKQITTSDGKGNAVQVMFV